MRWLSEAGERLRALLFRARVDAETEEEMRFHLEMEAHRREREGDLAPAEARRQAAIAFGGVERHVEEVRDARGFGWLSGLTTIEHVSALSQSNFHLTTAAGRFASAVRGARVPASALRMLGVQPLLGRLLVESDDAEAGTMPVLIGRRASRCGCVRWRRCSP